jgi:hypothetical protein
LAPGETVAQGTKIGNYTTSYSLSGSDTVLKYYPPEFFNNGTVFTVGALFEKGASEDTLAAIRVYHALTQEALQASTTSGNELTNNNINYNVAAEDYYEETTFTVSGGVNWIKVIIDRVGTSPDSSTVKPYIKVKY